MPSMANLLSFSPPSSRPLSLSLRRAPVPTPRLLTISASSLPIPPPPLPPSSLLLTSSTRTLTALLSSAASAAAPPHLLFARVQPLHIPARRIILTLIRATIEWLNIYVMLMEAKLLLSFIPDTPWLHTPLAAFRSVLDYLCHPFLSIVSARACADPDLRLILVIDLFLSLRWLLARALCSLL